LLGAINLIYGDHTGPRGVGLNQIETGSNGCVIFDRISQATEMKNCYLSVDSDLRRRQGRFAT